VTNVPTIGARANSGKRELPTSLLNKSKHARVSFSWTIPAVEDAARQKRVQHESLDYDFAAQLFFCDAGDRAATDSTE
jgi:hypothetical protein